MEGAVRGVEDEKMWKAGTTKDLKGQMFMVGIIS